MNHDHETVWTSVGKACAWVAAWLGTITVADVQPYVSVASGGLVGVLAAVNLFTALKRKAWRDKQ